MSKPKTISAELLPADAKTSALSLQPSALPLGERAARINNYHQSVIRAFGQQMGYAFLCGLELNAAKEEIAHGQFEKWREQFLPDLPRSTANNYRNFATLLQEKSKTLTRLTDRAQNLLTNGEFADTDRTEILQAVHDVADGKTLTDLYRALGVVRDKVHQKDRDNSRKHAPTAEDQKKLNVEITHRLANDARAWRTTAAIQKDCDTSDLNMLLDELVSVTRHLRDLLKSRRSANKPNRGSRGDEAPTSPRNTMSTKQRAEIAKNARARWAKIRAQKGTAK